MKALRGLVESLFSEIITEPQLLVIDQSLMQESSQPFDPGLICPEDHGGLEIMNWR